MASVAGERAAWERLHDGSVRDACRRALLAVARADRRVLCLDSDMGGLEDVFADLPGQYLNFGIAEANMMSAAAGLAAAGKVPFVNTMAGFACARAGEQLKLDVAGNGLPVKVLASHAGLSAGHFGPTHQALEDLAFVRALPGMTVVVPADTVEAVLAVRAVAGLPGPAYIRVGRRETPRVHVAPCDFQVGRAIVLRPGGDLAIAACGPHPVAMALEAGDRLAAVGVRARVLDVHTVKPLDEEAITAAAVETGGIVTVEEHSRLGGLGGAVAELVCERAPCRVLRVAAPDRVCDLVGDQEALLAACGVSAAAVVAAALEVVGRP